MAWFNSGVWDDLRVATHAELLAEMCVAVNERRGYSGVSLITWTATGNTLPVAADFDDILVAHDDVKATILQIREFVEDYVLVSTSGHYWREDATPWTDYHELLEESSAGETWETDEWIALDRVSDLLPLLQIRTALDWMIYIREETEIDPGEADTRSGTSGGASQQADSWDNAVADSPSTGSFTPTAQILTISQTNLLAPDVVNTTIRDSGYCTVDWDDSWGKVVRTVLILLDHSLGDTACDPLAFTVNSTIYSMDNGTLNTVDEVDISPAVDWTSAPQNLTFELTVPGANPVDNFVSFNDVGGRGVSLKTLAGSYDNAGHWLLKQLRVGTDLTYG